MRQPRRLRGFLLLAVCCAGCTQAPPPLAGGKPVRYWIEALHAPDARLRKKAAFKLGNAGAAHTEALQALTGALNDSDAAVRRETIVALLKFGPAAAEAMPTLLALQQSDPNAQVRRYAAKAAEKIQTNP